MIDQDPSERIRWSAVRLIYSREMRDQLRDRRTLFTILILPLLLYPLIGSVLMQVTQFSNQPVMKIAVIGNEHLQDLPPLFEAIDPVSGEPACVPGGPDSDNSQAGQINTVVIGSHENLPMEHRFADSLLTARQPMRLTLYRASEFGDQAKIDQVTGRWVNDGVYDIILKIPENLVDIDQHENKGLVERGPAPGISLVYNAASGPSNSAVAVVTSALQAWKHQWVQRSLEGFGIGQSVLQPFEVTLADIAKPDARQTMFWSKLLPMVMLVWAMTGAFYPAIDMVAGEKERGTLETLLCSPALRGEIVWGKLAAVTTFSMLTAILNTISMLSTGAMVFSQIGIGEPTTMPLWTVVLLLGTMFPLSIMFSGIALGLSAMARSSKEGQYYLMPMMMAIIPFVVLPSMPGISLSIGTSLIPVTGMFLLVRSLIESNYTSALVHLPMVAGVTIACVGLVLRWTMRLFENESVLFHGGQPFNPGRMLDSIRENRQTYAKPNQAYALAVVILVGLFFGRLMFVGIPDGVSGLAKMVLGPQLGMILLPSLILAAVCTKRARIGLRLRMPTWNVLLFSVVLGFALHPAYMLLTRWVMVAYPISESAIASMRPLTDQMAATPWIYLVLLMAVVPAICEELAFRGFMFGGLLRDRQPFRAILVTAVLFGVSHGVLQQSISATVMGFLLGWIAWRTGSVVPTILIHTINNTLSVSLPNIAEIDIPAKSFILDTTGDQFAYQPMWCLMCITFSIAILVIFGALRGDADEQSSTEETDTDTLSPGRDAGTFTMVPGVN
ncbi:MAG TPA: CPBP family intramembrane metalloprotease domain-containing protein [Planctomycetaceae bacterium]|nr:CPBP family intramembrane metalloprotease domain-containing protein [Planctomycetaceae bacterium]